MPEWASVLLGIVVGIFVITSVLFLAFKPQDRNRKSRLAPPSGNKDAMTAAKLDDYS